MGSQFTGSGICECGCGRATSTWPQNRPSKGIKKGDPRRFIAGHQGKKYQTEKDSPRATCHPDRPVKARGLCGACYHRWLDERDPEAKQRKLERRRVLAKKAREKDPHHASKQRNRVLKHRYGITASEYEALLAKQNGRCAICDTAAENTRSGKLYVDHQHNTGTTRELICPRCNTALGVLEAGVNLLLAYGAYLRKHDPTHEVGNALARLELQLRQ